MKRPIILLTLLFLAMLAIIPRLEAQGGFFYGDGLRYVVSAQTCADNGGGTAASKTITVLRSYVALTQNDANGCALTLSESGARDGMSLTIVNVSANSATIADSSGVQETNSGSTITLAMWTSATFIYVSDRWVQTPVGGGGGSGDVVGPGSSTDEAVARFDSTTGKLLQNTSTLTLSDAGAFTFADGVRQTFNPNGTSAGINVGSQAGDPGTPSNGDLWYDSTANELTARINGSNVSLGSGGGAPTGATYLVGALDGTLSAEINVGGDDAVPVGSGSTSVATTLPSCSNSTTSKLLYNSSTNAFSCGTDQDNGSAASNYQTVQDETSGLTQRPTINFTGAGVSCVDNAGATRTDCTIAGTTQTQTFGITIDGGGSAFTTGVKGFAVVPLTGTITSATLLSTDASVTSCSVVIDVWKDTYANYPPTDADSITASAPPTLSSATKSQDSTLTGWTTSVTAGQVVGFNVDSVSGCTRVTLTLMVQQ